MHGQIGVLHQTFLYFMSPSDDPEQAGIGRRLIISVLDEHSHLAADALQSCHHRQRQNVVGAAVSLAILRSEINRLRSKQRD